MFRMPMRLRLALAGAVLLTSAAALCRAQELTPGPVPPATQPVAPEPNPPAALRPLDAKVQQVFTQASEAYKALKTYRDLGAVTTTMVIGGRPAETTSPASTTFARPNKYISNLEALHLYSDGRTLWMYAPTRSVYYQQPLDAPAPEGGTTPTPQSIMRNLPVLTMLNDPDHSLLATQTAFDSKYRGQEQLAGKLVDHVALVSPADAWFGATDAAQSGANRILVDMFLDVQNHMVLRLHLDLSTAMRNRITRFDQQRQEPQLNQATWQFNAGQVRLNTPIAEDTFTFRPPADAERVDAIAALFSPTAGRPPVNDEEQAESREAEPSRVPYPAPDFTLPDLVGRQVRLSDLRGKVVVLDFWATWCGPCRVSLPHVQKVYDDFKDRGVLVLGVDIGEDAKTVLAFVEKNRMTFPILVDEDDKVSPLYHISAIPHTLVVDQKGTVVKVHTGFVQGQEDQLRSEVAALLGGVASQPAASQPTAARSGGPATRPAIMVTD